MDNFPRGWEGQTPPLLLRTNVSGGGHVRLHSLQTRGCQEPMSHSAGGGLPALRAKKATTETKSSKHARTVDAHGHAGAHLDTHANCHGASQST